MPVTCSNGHSNPDGSATCAVCAVPIAPPTPPVIPAPPAAAPFPAAVAPSAPRTRSRTPWIISTALLLVVALAAGYLFVSTNSKLNDTKKELNAADASLTDQKATTHDVQGQLNSAQHQLDSSESDLASANNDLTDAQTCMKGLAQTLNALGSSNAFRGAFKAYGAMKSVQSECKAAFSAAGTNTPLF